MTNRLGWSLIPMLALAVVSVTAADDPGRSPAVAKNTAASASSADKTVRGVPRRAGTGGSGAGAASKKTSIVGGAWNADSTPIKGANLRLRDVVTGKIAAVARANEAGEFTFENVAGGSYLVELVSDSGHVQSVGHVFTIAPGETVATFVRLGPKISWTAAFFSNTAGSVASTAATEGIAAMAPAGLCQSPPCH